MVLLFVSVSSVAFAQIAIGPKVGFNFANVSAESEGLSISFGTLTGSSIGAVLEISTSGKFAIQPEIAFMQKGFKLDLGALAQSEQKLNYMEITGLAKFKFGGDGFGGYLAAGPSFGYALSGSVTDENTGEKEDINFDEEDGFNRPEVSIALGGGLNFGLGSNTLFADLRFLAGISNLADSEEPDDPKVRNQGVLLTVGILFNL